MCEPIDPVWLIKTKRIARRLLPGGAIALWRSGRTTPASSVGASVSRLKPIGVAIEGLIADLWEKGDPSSQRLLGDCLEQENIDSLTRYAAGMSLGSWLLANGDAAAAIPTLEKCCRLTDRRDVPSASLLADALSRMGRHEDALATLAPLAHRREIDCDTALRIGSIRAQIEGDRNYGSGAVVEALNRMYARVPLALLFREDVSKPLSLSNLRAAAPRRVRLADEPLVSVVIPSANSDPSPALISLARQTWNNLEVLVLAPKPLHGAVHQLADRIDFGEVHIELLDWPGETEWRKEGARRASGDYIMVHQPQEWSHPQRVELLATTFVLKDSLCGATTSAAWFDLDFRPALVKPNSSSVIGPNPEPMVRIGCFERLSGESPYVEHIHPNVPLSLIHIGDVRCPLPPKRTA